MLKFWLIIFYFSNIIVSASPWTEWVFHSFFINFFYFIHLASLYAIELIILSLIYVYLLLYLLKHLYNSILKYGFILIVFFLFQFYFMLFYVSGLVWSIEFWYGKFFSYSFFEYLASDFRIFFSTCVVLVLFSLNRFISNLIKQAYLRSYNQQQCLEVDMTKRVKTMLSKTRHIKINLIFFFILLSIVYLYYPSYLIYTFHWYSTLSWTFTYDAVITKSVDYYSYYKYLWISLTQLYCILYVLIVQLPVAPRSANHLVTLNLNKKTMSLNIDSLRRIIINVSKLNLVTSASDLKQKKNLINKKNNLLVNAVLVAVNYLNKSHYPILTIGKKYFSSINNDSTVNIITTKNLESMFTEKRINWLDIETAYIAQKYKLWFAAGLPEQKPTFKSFSLVNEENTLNNEKDNIITGLTALKTSVKDLTKDEQVIANLENLTRAYENSTIIFKQFGRLGQKPNPEAWNYQLCTDVLILFEKFERALHKYTAAQNFVDTNSIVRARSKKELLDFKLKHIDYVLSNHFLGDNSRITNPDVFQKFINGLYQFLPQQKNNAEVNRYCFIKDQSTLLNSLQKHLPKEDLHQLPNFQVGGFKISRFTNVSERVIQAFRDLQNIVNPTDASYGQFLMKEVEKMCDAAPPIDQKLLATNNGYRLDRWNIYLDKLNACYVTYANKLTEMRWYPNQAFPGIEPADIKVLASKYEYEFACLCRAFNKNVQFRGDVDILAYHQYQAQLYSKHYTDIFYNPNIYKCRDIVSPHFIQLLDSQLHDQVISSKEESLKLIQHLINRGVIVPLDNNQIIPVNKILTTDDLGEIYNKIPAEELYIYLPNMEAFLLNQAPIPVDKTSLTEKINDQILTSLLGTNSTKKKPTAVDGGSIVEEKNSADSLPPFADDVPVPDPIDTIEPIIPTESPLTLDEVQPVTWYTTIWDHVDVIVKLITSWWC